VPGTPVPGRLVSPCSERRGLISPTRPLARVYLVAVTSPWSWCQPNNAFGRLDVEKREWTPPDGDDPVLMTKFQAAVIQNAICVSVRKFKNEKGIAQEVLAREDKRSDSLKKWNARLCGRQPLSLQDIAVLMTVVAGALPTEAELSIFLQVAMGQIEPPPGWDRPDTCSSFDR
jgi:hypothetical protein